MWSRQVARAAGASLIAPLVLLVAAGIVASGGGLGGLESLGQIASGPSLPDTGLPNASSSSIERAEIVGADVPGPSRTVRPAPPQAGVASATPTAGASPRVEAAAPRPRTELGSSTEPPRRSPLAATGEGTLLGEPERTSPSPGDERLEGLQEATRGLGETLTEPLRPLGTQLVDLLRALGLQPR